jgi:uncharacterized protein
MRISLEPLRNAPGETFNYTLRPDADALGLTEDGILIEGPVDVRLDAVYRDGKIHVSGSLRTNVVLDCSRCLKSLTFPIEGDYEDEFLVEDITELGTNELVKEIIYTSLPLKPLCVEACKGLCTVCGENLNEKQCGCHVDKVDHRLAILKKLLQQE